MFGKKIEEDWGRDTCCICAREVVLNKKTFWFAVDELGNYLDQHQIDKAGVNVLPVCDACFKDQAQVVQKMAFHFKPKPAAQPAAQPSLRMPARAQIEPPEPPKACLVPNPPQEIPKPQNGWREVYVKVQAGEMPVSSLEPCVRLMFLLRQEQILGSKGILFVYEGSDGFQAYVIGKKDQEPKPWQAPNHNVQ